MADPKRDAKKADFAFVHGRLRHKACGGGQVYYDTSELMWKCIKCWDRTAQRGFWKKTTIYKWTDAELATRFFMEAVDDATWPL